MTPKTIVIIGSSAAGISAAREIRSLNNDIDITIITDDVHYPYYRPFLTEYLGNKDVEKKSNFFLNNEEWYREQKINLILGEKVVEINVAGKDVKTESGRRFKYDKLIIASGSKPFIPMEKALEKDNVFVVRSFSDAKRIYDYSNKIGRAIVIGGGLLGLEAAGSLVAKGMKVSIIELSPRILPLQLDPEGSSFMENILKEKGVELILGEEVKELTGDKTVSGVRIGSGRMIETDMVLFSIGVRSNIDLAKNLALPLIGRLS